MKTLYMKQAIMTLHKKIEVRDQDDNLAYEVSTDFFSLHDKTHIQNAQGEVIADLSRKLFSIHAKYFVDMKDGTSFELSTELWHLIKDIIDIKSLGWTIKGNFMEHDYELYDGGGNVLASTHRKWISLHEAYEIQIFDESQIDAIVTVFIVLEHILFTREQERATVGTGSPSGNLTAEAASSDKTV